MRERRCHELCPDGVLQVLRRRIDPLLGILAQDLRPFDPTVLLLPLS